MKKSKLILDRYAEYKSQYVTIKEFWEDYADEVGFIDNRKRENVRIKHAFFVSAQELTSVALADIGAIIDKDHATVLHAKKKHEENLLYLPGYKAVYQEIKYNLEKRLDSDETKNEVSLIDDVKELRARLINVTARLRMKTIEVNTLHRQIKESPARAVEENKFFSKQNRELYQKNKYLQAEVNRLKNLL